MTFHSRDWPSWQTSIPIEEGSSDIIPLQKGRTGKYVDSRMEQGLREWDKSAVQEKKNNVEMGQIQLNNVSQGRLRGKVKSGWSRDEETTFYWKGGIEGHGGRRGLVGEGGGLEGRVRWEMRVTIRDKNSVNMLDMSLAGTTLALEETMKHIIGSVSHDGWRPGSSVSPLSARSPVGTNHLGPAP